MLSYRRRFFFLLTLLIGLKGYAQSTQPNPVIRPEQLQNPIPASPNAASLGKYGEIPVGTYNGIPDISIPIYTINTGKLQLPVSLSYHAGGIKVEETASMVGLGWSLSAPGAVVKQTRGLADEIPGTGFFDSRVAVSKFINNQMTASERDYFLLSISKGEMDSEPDLYTYNINGLSGSFFFDLDDNIITIPKSKNLISKIPGGWTIKDNSGTLYTFLNAETTLSVPQSIGSSLGYDPYLSTTSWFITKIEDLKSGSDEIHFEYETYTSSFVTNSSQTTYILNTGDAPCSLKEPTSFFSTNTITSQRIKKIVFKNGEINFTKAATNRLDLLDDYALDNIEITNNNSTFKKKIHFEYDYVESPGVNEVTGSTQQYYRRLILNKVYIDDGSTAVSEGFYAFQYNNLNLPNRLSYDQDFWGYYNQANNGSKFVPSTILNSAGSGADSRPVNFAGANRLVNPEASQNGMLSKIFYPTGGYTTFLFESNDAFTTKYVETGFREGVAEVGTRITETENITYSPQFTLGDGIPTNGIDVPATIIYSNSGQTTQTLDYPRIDLYNQNGYYAPINASGEITLPEGIYYLRIDRSGVNDTDRINNAHATILFPIQKSVVIGDQTFFNIVTGGHRIKEIRTYDQLDQLTGSKFYSYKDPQTNNSTGRLVNFANYISSLMVTLAVPQENDRIEIITCNYISISSNSTFPMASTKGSTTGYKYVKETNGINGEGGQTEFFYTSSEVYPDIIDTEFPYPPNTSRDWLRGNLITEVKSKRVQNGQITSWQKVQERIVEYQENELSSLYGLKGGQRVFANYPSEIVLFQTKAFLTQSSWFVPVSETTHIYDANNEAVKITTATDYTYNFSNQSVNEAEVTAKKGVIINKIKYPLDYATLLSSQLSENQGIINLVNSNMLSTPIEEYSIRKGEDNVEYVVAGKITTYKIGKPYPDKVYGLELTEPLPLSSFIASSINASGQFIKDNHYRLLFEYEFDNNGNLTSNKKSSDMLVSFLWGYGNQYPVVEAKNAGLSEIAATSFESSETGNWNGITTGNIITGNAITGRKYYNLSNAGITVSGLPQNDAGYIVSYWSKNGIYQVSDNDLSGVSPSTKTATINGEIWTLYQKKVRGDIGSITISGAGAIDEVRIFPYKGNMTTYTYDPNVGVTSKCDSNNLITYYEYDKIGRLQLIRDQEYHVVKVFQYQYQIPVP